MALAFRPRLSPSSMSSRYGSLVLGDGLGRLGHPELPETDPPGSVVPSMAVLEARWSPYGRFCRRAAPHPGSHTTTPAAFRYPLAVSLRTPVASSMCRKDHPSFPSAVTCCLCSSLKTLLMPSEPIRAPIGVNVPSFCYGRFSGDLIWPDLADR
jgi:hypothetical protein